MTEHHSKCPDCGQRYVNVHNCPLGPKSLAASAGYAAELEDEQISALKIKLNGLIWEYGSGHLPLTVAEQIACDCLELITEGKPHNRVFDDTTPENITTPKKQ